MVEGILTHVEIIEAFPYLSDLLDIFKGGRNIILSTHSYISYVTGSLYLDTIFYSLLFMTFS